MHAETFKTLCDRVNAFQLQLIDSGWLEADAQWHFDNICSPFNRLYFVAAGEAVVFNGNVRINLQPGCIYLIPAGVTNHYHCPSAMQKAYFHFNILMPNGIDLMEGLQTCVELPAVADEIVLARTLVRSESLADAFMLKQLLDGVVARFISATQVESQALRTWSDLLVRFFALIFQKVTAQTRVCDLAKQLTVAPDTLSRRFRQETGKKISSYLEDLLLRKACQMLLSSNRSIGQIAEELQFCDPYYFSRFFKSRMHETPTAYRRRLSRMI